MPQPSNTHLILIPTYNTGPLVIEVVNNALKHWQPVWVVVDGSTDGSGTALDDLANLQPHLCILHHSSNKGKGSAILTGIQSAAKRGFTHALTMDADGQHPHQMIREFMEISSKHPQNMILGKPIFDDEAPIARVQGRKISNFWANLETLWAGINDSLCGFRVYPIQPLIDVMESCVFARRFDFDAEVAIRMAWRGIPLINREIPVRYLEKNEGGVSQFRYIRDNTLLTWMHIRLFLEFLVRFPLLVYRRIKNTVKI